MTVAAGRPRLIPILAAAAVAAVLLIYVYPYLLGLPLFDPDEGLHAAIAQGMVERGDWVVPRFLGEPFLDKPILYFWAQAASLRLFGYNEAAIRLPGTLFALLGIVTTAWLAAVLLAPRRAPRPAESRGLAALTAGLLYATMFFPAALAQVPVHDVALAPCVNLALLVLFVTEERRGLGVSLVAIATLGVLFAWAMLVKGLVGIAIIAVAYGGYLLVMRRWRLIMRLAPRILAALFLGTLLVAPWYWAMQREEPGFLYYFLVERHLQGFAGDKQLHSDRPIWYYLPILLGGGLPWIGYLPLSWRLRGGAAAATHAVERQAANEEDAADARARDGHALLWAWLIGGALLLSAAGSKMVTYIWPLFPPIAILAAVPWSAMIAGRLSGDLRSRFARALIPSSALGPIVVPLVPLVAALVMRLSFPWYAWVAVVAAGATAWVPLWCALTDRRRALLPSATLSVAIQFAVVLTMVLPAVAPTMTARALAEHFNRAGRLPNQVIMADERIGSLVFYLDPPLRAGLDDARLHFGKLHYGLAIDNEAEFTPRPGAVAYLPESAVASASRYADLEGLRFERVDRYRRYDAAALKARTLPPEPAEPEEASSDADEPAAAPH